MKNIRLKILLIICLLMSGLVVYSWIQNSYQIDFLITKNNHYHNRMIQGIKESQDIDYVKLQAIQIIEAISENTNVKNERAIKVSKTLIGLFVLTLMTNILIIILLIRKTPHNKA